MVLDRQAYSYVYSVLSDEKEFNNKKCLIIILYSFIISEGVFLGEGEGNERIIL